MEKGQKMDSVQVDYLAAALVSLRTADEAKALLLDICSTKEIEDLAARLEVARLLAEGKSYVAVQQLTGASSTTVSRVNKCLNGEVGGYRTVLERLSSAK